MEKEQTVEKVLEFVQSDPKAKIFRLNYSVFEELREVMVNEVLRDFMVYASNLYYADQFPILKEYADEHHTKIEKRETLVENLFWWRIFFESSMNYTDSCIDNYVAENYHLLIKRPIFSFMVKRMWEGKPEILFCRLQI